MKEFKNELQTDIIMYIDKYGIDAMFTNGVVDSLLARYEPKKYIDAINLILPLAKGYVAENDIGSNQVYIEIAENAVKKEENNE